MPLIRFRKNGSRDVFGEKSEFRCTESIPSEHKVMHIAPDQPTVTVKGVCMHVHIKIVCICHNPNFSCTLLGLKMAAYCQLLLY